MLVSSILSYNDFLKDSPVGYKYRHTAIQVQKMQNKTFNALTNTPLIQLRDKEQ